MRHAFGKILPQRTQGGRDMKKGIGELGIDDVGGFHHSKKGLLFRRPDDCQSLFQAPLGSFI